MRRTKDKIICIIPARGGSRGLVGKNFKPLAGMPLIAHTIEQAKKVRLISRVIVSTDNKKIARIARRFGAEVPFIRPKELAQDLTPDWPVFEHALKWLASNEGYRPDFIVHLRCTSPLRRASDIKAGIEKMIKFRSDSVISVSLVSQPPQKMWRIDTQGRLSKLLPPKVKVKGGPESPRQLLEPIYRQNGIVDIIRYETIMKKKSMFGKRPLSLVTNQEEALDIDTPLDFSVIEAVIKNRKSGNLSKNV